ncbi:MAG TPA: [protein-PII] uridylyltransferase [Acidimicrobiales bacterium]|nr:[protein-PII] uridylyltransferase [Acidimicrobiales bacterium]
MGEPDRSGVSAGSAADGVGACSSDDGENRPASAGVVPLRRARRQLCDAVLDGSLPAAAYPAACAAAADAWLSRLFEAAAGTRQKGLALLGVGGYGHGSLSPGSDLDLVLVHRHRRDTNAVAKRLWYGIWDDGIKLDHSVRSIREAIEVARQDPKVLLGLLDARLVTGAADLAEKLRNDVALLWRRELPRLLPALEAGVAARHDSYGELAFLLEPDLKQSAGGLRDLAMLRVLGAALPGTAGLVASPALVEAEQAIIAARVALQCCTGSASDRLVLQEQDRISPVLGVGDADELMAGLAHAARRVVAATELAWREANALRRAATGRSPARPQQLPGGIVVGEDEVSLDEGADLADAALPLRLARAAAERGLHVAPASLDELAAVPPPPLPWPRAVREEFLALLATGAPAVPVLEALDRHGLWERFVPEWSAVRNRPQRNAYHRFTVDRHLLEAASQAARLASRVDRPDLLVAGALFHDIGKGFAGDHSESGAGIAEIAGGRMGFPDADVAVLRRLVSYHLLLPEVATRRDLDDPATAKLVARLAEDRGTLRLLAALTEADSIATGPTAWTPWKAELLATLVERAERVLAGERPPEPRPLTPAPSQLAAVEERRLTVEAVGGKVSVVAPDRHGVLAAAAGVLALNGWNVRRATAGPCGEGMVLDVFIVEPLFDRQPDWRRVAEELQAGLEGRLQLGERLDSQDRAYAAAPLRRLSRSAGVRVTIDNDASERCSVIEVRAPDSFGLLYRITSTLADAGLDVASALVDTLGHEVVDAFYVLDADGAKLGAARMEELRGLLEGTLSSGEPEEPAGEGAGAGGESGPPGEGAGGESGPRGEPGDPRSDTGDRSS